MNIYKSLHYNLIFSHTNTILEITWENSDLREDGHAVSQEEEWRRKRAKVNKIKIYLSKVLKISRNNLVWEASTQSGSESSQGVCSLDEVSGCRERIKNQGSIVVSRYSRAAGLQESLLQVTELCTVLLAVLLIQPRKYKKEIIKEKKKKGLSSRSQDSGC